MSDFKITTAYTEETKDLPHAKSPDFVSRGYNDLKLGSDGDISLVSETEQLAQDILKILLTKEGSNSYVLTYGSDFSEVIGQGQTEYSSSYLSALIRDKIVASLQILQEILDGNAELSEQLGAMFYYKAEIEDNDTIVVNFSILARSGESVVIVFIPA